MTHLCRTQCISCESCINSEDCNVKLRNFSIQYTVSIFVGNHYEGWKIHKYFLENLSVQ
jgi:predicted DNA-binding helix-hairpin-helix protein